MQERKSNQVRETGEGSDKEDFDLVFYDVSDDSEQCNKKVKFKNMPKVIPDFRQLCTIDGSQYCRFNKNSEIRDTGASCSITYDDTSMYDVKKSMSKLWVSLEM